MADITYIRLRWEFVYLAVILDAYSRRVVGWALEDTLEGKLTIAALRMALQRRRPGAGLLHHSDRGVQYAANRLRRLIEAARNHHQHEPQSQPLRQCQSGIFHEDAEVRRGLPLGVPRSGRSARFDRVLSREVYNEKRLHSLWAIARRRSSSRTCLPRQRFRRQWRKEFSEAWGNLSIR